MRWNLLFGNTYHIELDNEGTYHLELEHESCGYLIANVNVIETKPICSISLLMKTQSFKLACKWIPRHAYDEAQIIVNNRTLCSYENDGIANDNLNISMTVNAIAAFNDIFSHDEVSSICLVSQFGVEKSCAFAFMSMKPKSVKLKETNKDPLLASFACCVTDDERPPEIWLYDKRTFSLIFSNSTERDNFTFNETKYAYNFTFVTKYHDSKYDIILLCSRIGNQRTFGIGKIILKSEINQNVLLSITITSRIRDSNESSDETYCKHKHNIISLTFSNAAFGNCLPDSSCLEEFGTSILNMSAKQKNGWTISRESLEKSLFSQGNQNLIMILVLGISSLALIALLSSITIRHCPHLMSRRYLSVNK